jgi:8-oxo-dGTP pyrophosphatase MutT (NUDIX family)
VTCQALHENTWVSLMIVRKPDAGVDGYVYSHETRCRGRIVAVLPYREGEHGREYLVKSEMTPCWGFDQYRSAITGGYEGGDIEDDAVREMLEETGYAITRDELIPLGESFASKSSDTVYSLFTVDLTGREAGEATGDGTRVEAESAAVWVHLAELGHMRDPQLHVMFLRIFAKATIPVDDLLARAAGTGAQHPAPAGRLARVEVKGFRDLGVVRVSETTLAGEPMLHAECGDGSSADFPPSSLHFITWLPDGADRAPRAIAGPVSRPCLADEADDEYLADEADDEYEDVTF